MFNSLDREDFEQSIGWIFRLRAQELLGSLAKMLTAFGYTDVEHDKDFVYAPGTLPVLMVAHVDTVHKSPVITLCYDSHEKILWSPQGVGGDDRAGVLGILKLLERGHRPHVLFTDGEESGGKGAKAFTRASVDIPDVRFAIELDRRNGTEAVFYQCKNKDFEEYVLGFGFSKATGTFTDISVICPDFKIAGVNLSCGYYNAHTTNEYLSLPELENVLLNVEHIFAELPAETFVYNNEPPLRAPVIPLYTSAGYYNKGKSYSYDGDGFDVGDYEGYGNYYSGVNHINYKYPDEFDFTVPVSLLISMYGGTYGYWQMFLRLNHDDLVEYAKEAVMLAIDEAITLDDAASEVVELDDIVLNTSDVDDTDVK